MSAFLLRPLECNYVSHVAYMRALEKYVDFLESEIYGDDDGQPDEGQEWESFDPDC